MRRIAVLRASTPIAAAAASLLAILAAPVLAQPIATPEAGWAAVARCAAVRADKDRHRCLDEVLRQAGLLPGANGPPPAPAAAPAPVPPPAAAPRPSAGAVSGVRGSFGLETSPARTARRGEPPKPAEPGRLEVTLAKVELDGEGKLVLTTTDGAVWRQVESDPVRPAPAEGQTMTIEKKSLGGFMCRASRWAAFRCIRTS
jgi:hypothetical protein